MRPSTLLLSAASLLATQTTAQNPTVYTNFSTVTNSTFSFGRHYAVLNLDLINGLVLGVVNTTAGDAWITSTARWIDAVHAQSPAPLSVFSRIYFSNARRPEIGPLTPFAAVAKALPGNANEVDYVTQVYDAFVVKPDDVVVQKSRYYAGFGNQLEEVLRSQLIDTVVLVSPFPPPASALSLKQHEKWQLNWRACGGRWVRC